MAWRSPSTSHGGPPSGHRSIQSSCFRSGSHPRCRLNASQAVCTGTLVLRRQRGWRRRLRQGGGQPDQHAAAQTTRLTIHFEAALQAQRPRLARGVPLSWHHLRYDAGKVSCSSWGLQARGGCRVVRSMKADVPRDAAALPRARGAGQAPGEIVLTLLRFLAGMMGSSRGFCVLLRGAVGVISETAA